MNNIFENAKFGDPFKTNNGTKALFLRFDILNIDTDCPVNICYCYTLEDGEMEYTLDGRCYADMQHTDDTRFDIVSRYKEPIDEDKLEELACECAVSYCGADNEFERDRCDMRFGFKIGYRKAKEE